MYGSYDFPFGKGKQFLPDANHATDLLVGGWQLSDVTQWSGGLPFHAWLYEAQIQHQWRPGLSDTIEEDANQPDAVCGQHRGTGSRTFYAQQSTDIVRTQEPVSLPPRLDHFGNAGINTYRGPASSGTTSA